MARVIDDIIHYFDEHDIDIMESSNVLTLCMSHGVTAMASLGRREWLDADILRAIVESEQTILALEEQVRTLWAERRHLRKALANRTP